MVQSKESIRKAMVVALSQIDEKVQRDISEKLQANLFASELWKNAKTIGTYLSVKSEWDTRNIVDQALAEGKKVAVPKTIHKTKDLVFYEMKDWHQILPNGYFGLDEPDVEQTHPLDKDAIDLLIVPGLVFTPNGYRVGHGGGYYDRFLTDFIHPTVALAHSKQLVDNFPIESYDIPVHYLVTEQGMID